MKPLRFLTGLALALVACHDEPTSVVKAPAVNQRTIRQNSARYIVQFRDDVRDPSALADRMVAEHAGRPIHKWHAAIKGFAAEFPAAEVAAIARDPRVAIIEPDGIAHIVWSQSNPPSWGLDRIDQRALPLNAAYTYYANGYGVWAYIIDTGIWYTHNEFGGRAVQGQDEVTPGGNAQDCNGHGTHVAGIVGGSSVGVAKSVRLVSVRVLGCDGTGHLSDVISGVEYVTAQKQANPSTPMVANMSLGGSKDTVVNNAVTSSIAAGVTYAVAAGNSASDACNYSPASTPNAITVGATDSTDAMAWFSNYGTCLKIFAPGVHIYSAWDSSNSAYRYEDGTSMATPHFAGAAALYLQINRSATPASVAAALTDSATLNVITGLGPNSPNKLLYVDFIILPTLSVTMTGPSLVRPNVQCGWWANPTGGVPPYSYTWIPAGTQGDPNEVIEAFSSSGTLTVWAYDAAGQQASTSKIITVSSSAPLCPYAPVH